MLMAMQKLRFLFLNENRIDELPTRPQLEELRSLFSSLAWEEKANKECNILGIRQHTSTFKHI